MKSNKSLSPDFSGISALVIDDEEESRHIMTDFLHEIGMTDVIEHKSATDALSYLKEHTDWRGIILCDWNMPGMTGAELHAHIKKNNQNIPFVIVTGRQDEESVIHARDNGIYAYLLKPFSLAELERKLAKVSTNHHDFLFVPPQLKTSESPAASH